MPECPFIDKRIPETPFNRKLFCPHKEALAMVYYRDYRFLGPGDRLLAGDEFLDDDEETWLPVHWIFLKCTWSPLFRPVRRPKAVEVPDAT
jgi:hypothetical protein